MGQHGPLVGIHCCSSTGSHGGKWSNGSVLAQPLRNSSGTRCRMHKAPTAMRCDASVVGHRRLTQTAQCWLQHAEDDEPASQAGEPFSPPSIFVVQKPSTLLRRPQRSCTPGIWRFGTKTACRLREVMASRAGSSATATSRYLRISVFLNFSIISTESA